MTILFTARKADLKPGLKTLAERKLEKLERLLHENPDAHIILTQEKHRHLAEIIVRARVGTLTAKADGADFQESLGQAIDRLVAQARKHHEKIARGRKRRAMRDSPRRSGGAALGAPGPDAPLETDGPVIVPMGRVPVKPMSVEEALLLMQDSPDPFLVFRDADSQQVSVIFRRGDGRFGLIEPET
ncbi:MAG: ribosome-associated translation inhibitor RaiA [Acidobacteria bacterium]|nr:MAG: ribosome-associated translation inhibitor RaiA [Acidobacteriota bacterium]